MKGKGLGTWVFIFGKESIFFFLCIEEGICSLLRIWCTFFSYNFNLANYKIFNQQLLYYFVFLLLRFLLLFLLRKLVKVGKTLLSKWRDCLFSTRNWVVYFGYKKISWISCGCHVVVICYIWENESVKKNIR